MNGSDVLIVYDTGRTNQFVNFWLAFPLQIGDRVLSRIHNCCELVANGLADILHCFQPCHLVSHCGFALEQIGLPAPESFVLLCD